MRRKKFENQIYTYQFIIFNYSVNLNNCSDVRILDSQFVHSRFDFLSCRLDARKLESRRMRNVEEKQNDAYAATAEIDPLGIELFTMIKKQLPDGLRWSGKDIEVQGVLIQKNVNNSFNHHEQLMHNAHPCLKHV